MICMGSAHVEKRDDNKALSNEGQGFSNDSGPDLHDSVIGCQNLPRTCQMVEWTSSLEKSVHHSCRRKYFLAKLVTQLVDVTPYAAPPKKFHALSGL